MAFLNRIVGKLKHVFKRRPPNAVQTWQANNGDQIHAFWLFATPVHVILGRDSYFLAETSIMLSEHESSEIVNTLNQHFSASEYTFYLKNNIWFLGLDKEPKIKTTSIEDVANKDVAAYLPVGEDALIWANLQNEIQMLLFNHPVNTAREGQALPIVNSLWFHGLGVCEEARVSS